MHPKRKMHNAPVNQLQFSYFHNIFPRQCSLKIELISIFIAEPTGKLIPPISTYFHIIFGFVENDLFVGARIASLINKINFLLLHYVNARLRNMSFWLDGGIMKVRKTDGVISILLILYNANRRMEKWSMLSYMTCKAQFL